MKIAFFEVRGAEKKYFDKCLKGHKIDYVKEPLTAENAGKYSSYDAVSVFIYSRVDSKALAKLTKLKLVATRSTGYDHVDVKACAKKKITVCNVPFYGENTVAEHTFALILALSRNVHKSYVRTQKDDYSIEGLKGFDLKGKTLGVIGAGRIGLHVVKTARGFGMNVLAYDVNRDKFLAEVMHFNYADLDELLKQSDIISLNAPYNKHTHHIIDAEAIKKMKKGVIIVNTSRGGLIDTDALLAGLQSGKIGGAGLDVIEGEELLKEDKQMLYEPGHSEALNQLAKDNMLFHMENVVFTPHIGFFSQEAIERIWQTTAENIVAFSEKKPENTVS